MGRVGSRGGGFLRIGGTPGDLHVSASLYRHPRRYDYGNRHYYDPHDAYPYRYANEHYYGDHHPVGYYDHHGILPYFGYNYSSVYYNEPVVYRLLPPTVVYVEPETVYIEREPETVVVYTDDAYTDDALLAPPPVVPAQQYAPSPPAQAPEAGPYQPIGGATQSVVQEGVDAFAAGHYDQAQKFFIEAVMADERDGYAKLLYGFAAFASGDYKLAGITLRRSLRTSEVLIYQPLDVRTLYPNQSAFQMHRHALQTYVVDHPQDRDAKFALAYLFYATAKPEVAAERFGELAVSDKDDELAMRLYETARSVERVVPE